MNGVIFDRRITPARPDRAAAHLRGQVEAAAFVEGEDRSVIAPSVALRREPRLDCALDTEALRGEALKVYEETPEGWAWVQLARDRYCGYMSLEALGASVTPTHQVTALRTLVFPGPDLKLPIVGALTLGSRLAVQDIDRGYARVSEGFVWAAHLAPVDAAEPDFVAVAERFIGVPYLWGGKSSLGLDCSGLVQVSLQAGGRTAPRDSDMQARDLGTGIDPDGPLKRGDLVFWKGHVGIMRDGTTLLHANAQAMMVSSELLAEAQARIAGSAALKVSAVKRI